MSLRLITRALLCLGGVLATDTQQSPDALWLANNLDSDESIVGLASGLQYQVVKSGPVDGVHPNASTPCECHYRGTLTDGTEFDSSYRRGKPATFAPNRVIAGWTEALQLMRPGDTWRLFVPPSLGYGRRGSPPKIPPASVLVFELSLLSVGESESPFTFFGVDFSQPTNVLVALAVGYALIRMLSGGGGHKGPRVSVEAAADANNPRVFFDMSIGGESAGKIEMELFSTVRGDV